MTSDHFLINEVAKIHGLTKKTLLYYDRINLFKPEIVDEETGYRYYSYQQFPYLKQIIYLKNLEFSLEEIDELLQDRDFKVLIDKLESRLIDVDYQLDELTLVKKDLEFLIDYYQQVQFIDARDLYKPGIKLYNERIIFYQLCENENSKKEVMMAYRRMLRTLITLNIFSQMPYGTIAIKPSSKTGSYYDSIGSFISLPKSMGLDNELVQERCKYAYMYKKGGYFDPESVSLLLKWVEDNGYEAVGNIYDYSLIDYTFTKSSEEMIQEIQVRII